jgi:protein involved in polysaccharide export with SLBB domain
MRNRLLAFLVLFVLLLVSRSSYAQDLLKAKDLSQFKVELLTETEITRLKTQMINAKMTIEQAEQIAISKGMPPAEFAKLKQKLLATNASGSNTGKLNSPSSSAEKEKQLRTNNSIDSLDTDVYDKMGRTKPLINPLIFGSELYTGVAPSFEPNLNLATPVNYILGPGDQLDISVYGIQIYDGQFAVNTEGNIAVPNVGVIKIAGLTIEAATEKIKTAMSKVYQQLRTEGAKLSVTLSKIRSIHVTVIGSNMPGNFTVSSLSTVFNVLYLAGGPSEFGSFREIELYRNNRLERKIDLYRLLLHGDYTDNVGLKDNDVIRIPSYKNRVELQGQLKRPGIFEVLPNENFSDIVAFASGFTDTAYYAAVKVFQRNDKERKVADLTSANFGTYKPQSGDVFIVSKILNRFENRVKITGAVFRPDMYELTAGLKVADLIRKADGLKEDAFTGRGQILRLQEDLTRSILSFDVRKALSGDPANNVPLIREDEILISSVHELRDSFRVTIQGEIRMPGEYEYVENLTLKDLIMQAGGVTDAAYNSIEIARMIKRDSVLQSDNRASNIIRTGTSIDLNTTTENIPLQPFDVVTIRKKAGYILPESVLVTGQVQYPGPYVLSSRNERVSDILRRAGGFTPDAFPDGAYLKRSKTKEELESAKDIITQLQKETGDSTNLSFVESDVNKNIVKVPLDLNRIIQAPGSIEDITLKEKDELFIPKFDAQVKVSGGVLLGTQLPYDKANNFTDYIYAAGGYSGDGWKKKAYIVYANGKAATLKHFLFFTLYPKVTPGSEIIVPKKPQRNKASMAEIIGISSALASLAGVVIAILSL